MQRVELVRVLSKNSHYSMGNCTNKNNGEFVDLDGSLTCTSQSSNSGQIGEGEFCREDIFIINFTGPFQMDPHGFRYHFALKASKLVTKSKTRRMTVMGDPTAIRIRAYGTLGNLNRLRADVMPAPNSGIQWTVAERHSRSVFRYADLKNAGKEKLYVGQGHFVLGRKYDGWTKSISTTDEIDGKLKKPLYSVPVILGWKFGRGIDD